MSVVLKPRALARGVGSFFGSLNILHLYKFEMGLNSYYYSFRDVVSYEVIALFSFFFFIIFVGIFPNFFLTGLHSSLLNQFYKVIVFF